MSYSVYNCHSALITNDHSLMGFGYNGDNRITSFLPKAVIENFTEFSIKDSSASIQFDPVSVVCLASGNLFMFSTNANGGRQLVLCDKLINGGNPVFLDIGNHQPVALFGGNTHSAAISSEGEVIFINIFSFRESPESRIASVRLPDNEKASSVACCTDSIVVLSTNNRVFTSLINNKSKVIEFSEVVELKDKEIICISGTFKHIFPFSKEGRVFGRGSNDNGKLGLGKEIKTSSAFTEISSLAEYKIRAAYAGFDHSLFETREGKILSCGRNFYGQLLLSSGPGDDVYSPTETTITEGASFCIAGAFISVVFIGGDPPQNTPNMRI